MTQSIELVLLGLLLGIATIGWLVARDRRIRRRDRHRGPSHGQWNRRGSLATELAAGLVLILQFVLLGLRVGGAIAWPVWAVMIPTEFCIAVCVVWVLAALGMAITFGPVINEET